MLLNYKPKACRFKYVLTPIVVGVLLAHSSRAQESEHLSSEQLTKQTIHRRALDAAIWGQPIVSFDAMRQAYFRDAKANYNDVIWWPKGAGWKNQSLTVNTSVRYLYFFFNTRNDGPVVLELPGAIDGAGFFGTITDAWFVPLVDIGSQGEDNGKGGKYLVLPQVLPPITKATCRPDTCRCVLAHTTRIRWSVPSWRANRKRTCARATSW